jgi:hypothetical protein
MIDDTPTEPADRDQDEMELLAGRLWQNLIPGAPGWRRGMSADGAARRDLARLSADLSRLGSVARKLDEHCAAAETRLAQSCPETVAPPLPAGTDWWSRPGPWRNPVAQSGLAGLANRSRIDDGVTLFRDSPDGDVTLGQIHPGGAADAETFAIALAVRDYRGTFVSLAIDLPPAAAEGLSRRHILRAEVPTVSEPPCPIFARLNIRHGPNTERIVRGISPSSPVAEFDLAYSGLDERRVTSLWLDLIADRPGTTRILFGDVILSRHPRGAF